MQSVTRTEPVDASTRLRIATRIHFALLRHYGEHVEVGVLLKHGADAREALWVCEASGDTEMAALARQFKHAERAEAKARPAKRASTPQDLAWARDTSGFGVTRPFEEDAPASGFAASNWLKPSTWLKRNPTRPTR
jgi:NAD-specific glutamate dehydrogenase